MHYELFVDVTNLINIWYAKDAAYHCAQFHIVVYEEVDGGGYYLVFCYGMQVVDA